MKLIKLDLIVVAIVSLLAAIVLIWNESRATCGYTTCKLTETMFVIVSVIMTREAAKIKV